MDLDGSFDRRKMKFGARLLEGTGVAIFRLVARGKTVAHGELAALEACMNATAPAAQLPMR